MTKQELEKFKKILMIQRDKIVHGINHLEEGTLNRSQRDASGDLSGYSFHMADVATDNFDREFSIELAASEQQILNKITVALKKIDDETFGLCDTCNKKIDMKRLNAMPYAPLCIDCQSAEEKKSKAG
jgi:RNA polymerase-binding protein DksA